jgi:flagellar export protein FliJ
MNRSKRFEPIAALAGVRETVAARALAASLKEVKIKETDLEQLRAYLEEYQRSAAPGGQAVDSMRLHNAQRFMTRLSDAVRAQEDELLKAKQRYRVEAERWRASHRHTQALERLVDKYYREELLELQRRNQTELDELVLRLTR